MDESKLILRENMWREDSHLNKNEKKKRKNLHLKISHHQEVEWMTDEPSMDDDEILSVSVTRVS